VLGIFDDAEDHSVSAQLCTGDILLLFTDGLFEVEGANGQIDGPVRRGQKHRTCGDRVGAQ
jgi:serine phosphatase RsbU (regulator of sigma subunit)